MQHGRLNRVLSSLLLPCYPRSKVSSSLLVQPAPTLLLQSATPPELVEANSARRLVFSTPRGAHPVPPVKKIAASKDSAIREQDSQDDPFQLPPSRSPLIFFRGVYDFL